MNDVLSAAIKERLALGYSKEQVLAELVAAGYPAAVAEEAYVAASNVNNTPPPPSEPVAARDTWLHFEAATEGKTDESGATLAQATLPASPPPSQPPPSPQPTEPPPPPRPGPIEHQPQPTVSSGHKRWLLIGGSAFAGVLLVGGIAYGFMSGSISKLTGSLFSTAPYATEQELIAGWIENSRGLKAYGFNLDYRVVIDERKESTPTFDPSVLAPDAQSDFAENIAEALQYSMIAEADIQLTASGILDRRNEAVPEFDVSVGFNMLAEPFIMRAAGSVRAADGVIYGKIEDIPANFQMYLSGFPVDRWVKLTESGQGILPVPSPLLRSQEVLRVLPPEITQLFIAEAKRLATLPAPASRKAFDLFDQQSALLGATLDTTKSTEEQMLLEESIALLKQYPIFSFVGEPKRTTLNGESVYAYELDLDLENLEEYLINSVRTGEAIVDEVLPVTEKEIRDSFDEARPILSELNRLSTITYFVRPDKTMAGASFALLFTFDHPEVKQQLGVDIALGVTRQNDATDITVPEDVYEKTLQEIGEEQIERMEAGECDGNPVCESLLEARAAGNDASVKQTLSTMRSYAELVYNENDYSYAGLCGDEEMSQMFASMVANNYLPGSITSAERDGVSGPGKIVCNDQPEAYAIALPLTSDTAELWCADSTGFMGAVAEDALRTGTDVSCE